MRTLLSLVAVAALIAAPIAKAQTAAAPSPSPSPAASPSPSPAQKHKTEKPPPPSPAAATTAAAASPTPASTTAASPTPKKKSWLSKLAAPATSPAASPAPVPASGKAPVAAAKPAADITPAPGGGPGLVWVNTKSHVYHKETSDWYGKTKQGKYMSEADAVKEGDKPAAGNPMRHSCSLFLLYALSSVLLLVPRERASAQEKAKTPELWFYYATNLQATEDLKPL